MSCPAPPRRSPPRPTRVPPRRPPGGTSASAAHGLGPEVWPETIRRSRASLLHAPGARRCRDTTRPARGPGSRVPGIETNVPGPNLGIPLGTARVPVHQDLRVLTTSGKVLAVAAVTFLV